MPLRPLRWLAVLGVLLAGSAHALPPPPCAPGRFVVQGSPPPRLRRDPYQGTPEHLAQTIVDFTDMFTINVPVGTQKIQPGRWHNLTGRPLYVYSVSGHMHQRGLRFTARRSNGTTIYENFDFAHPIFREFVPPIVLNHGDWIDYECLHDNGVTKPVRRDAFGNPTTLVFGTTTEDEMCTLNGEFYTD
jgi:hypothetical protein